MDMNCSCAIGETDYLQLNSSHSGAVTILELKRTSQKKTDSLLRYLRWMLPIQTSSIPHMLNATNITAHLLTVTLPSKRMSHVFLHGCCCARARIFFFISQITGIAFCFGVNIFPHTWCCSAVYWFSCEFQSVNNSARYWSMSTILRISQRTV